MRFSLGGIIILLGTLTAGCAGVEKVTLPATQKGQYDFPAYTLTPPANTDWRFSSESRSAQGVSFFHAKNRAVMRFTITPVTDATGQKTEDDIIRHLQDKFLKDFQLSPDFEIQDKDITRQEEQFKENVYKVLTIHFFADQKEPEIKIYYWINSAKEIVYTLSISRDLKVFRKNPEWENRLQLDVKQVLEGLKIKSPSAIDIAALRVDFALEDFNSLVNKRYNKSSLEELKRKYDILLSEIRKWNELKPKNYVGLTMLGELAMYNQKFENLGEGFNKAVAVDYFNQAIAIRKYYLSAYLNLAQIMAETGEWQKALDDYEMAKSISPNNENILYECGKMLEKNGQYQKAGKYYQAALDQWAGAETTRRELEDKVKKYTGSQIPQN